MNEVVKLYLNLINNPFAMKNYRKLEEWYKDNGSKDTSDVFKFVIESKYADDTPTDSK